MNRRTNLLFDGRRIARSNKRYVVWFYALNLVLALCGAVAFRSHAHAILDNSLYADKLLHGFDVAVFVEMVARPEMGPLNASVIPAMYFAYAFFLLTLLLLPGVYAGYASSARLPRDEFFRVCGRNVWRFIRLFLFFLLVAGPIAGILFGIKNALVKGADKTSNELLPFYVQLASTIVIFLVLTFLRIWFDLAQADAVIKDESRVRRSVGAARRSLRHNWARLLGTYVLITIVAAAVLALGLVIWEALVPAADWFAAFLVGQAILLFWLAARFCQRACAVAFCLESMRQSEITAVSAAAASIDPASTVPRASTI
ncbi:MAG TPA: hypothetical protein VFI95_11625 [Terriglobales bacterium]|nr:hypothetical protein [Terriglobales bacterium]